MSDGLVAGVGRRRADGNMASRTWGKACLVGAGLSVLTPFALFLALGMAQAPAKGSVDAVVAGLAVAAVGPVVLSVSLVGYALSNCLDRHLGPGVRRTGVTAVGLAYVAMGAGLVDGFGHPGAGAGPAVRFVVCQAVVAALSRAGRAGAVAWRAGRARVAA